MMGRTQRGLLGIPAGQRRVMAGLGSDDDGGRGAVLMEAGRALGGSDGRSGRG